MSTRIVPELNPAAHPAGTPRETPTAEQLAALQAAGTDPLPWAATEYAVTTEEDDAREREIATARRFLVANGHAVVDMRRRDASVVPIGVDWPRSDTGDEPC